MTSNSRLLSRSPQSHQPQQIAICSSPEEDCAAFAVRAIDTDDSDILAGAYGLTTGSGIVEALVRVKGH